MADHDVMRCEICRWEFFNVVSHFLFFVLSYLVNIFWIFIMGILSALLICFQFHDTGSPPFLNSQFRSDVSLVSFPKEKHESVDNFIFGFLSVYSSESVIKKCSEYESGQVSEIFHDLWHFVDHDCFKSGQGITDGAFPVSDFLDAWEDVFESFSVLS